MSYYEDRIKALEARIKEMSLLNRMKAIPVEAKLMDRIHELNKENARLKAEVERLTKQTDYERMYRETIALLKKHNL
jgi:cell division protein FtsB